MVKKHAVRLGVLLVAIAVTGVVAWTVLSPGATPSSGAAPAGDTEWVTYTEPRRIAPMDPTATEAANAAAAVVEANEEHFLGSYVEPTGTVVMVAATDEGEALAAQAFDAVAGAHRVERATISLPQADKFGDEIRGLRPDLAEAIFMWGADPQARGVFVTTRRQLDNDERRAVNEFAERRGVRIRVELESGASEGTLD